jgi:phosphate transport system substrate-binding protein
MRLVKRLRLRRVRCAGWGALLVLLLLVGMVACAGPAGSDLPHRLRLAVADCCEGLAGRLAAAYERERRSVAVEIEVFNSAVAQHRLQEGEADLALLSSPAGDPGAEGLWTRDFAPQIVAVIVHPSLALEETDLDQLRAVFQARLREVDGQPLQPVSREEGSGTRALFEWAVLGNDAVAQTAVLMPSCQAVVEYVARSPGAVGYVSTDVLDVPVDAGVRILKIEGVLPTAVAAVDGSYPLSSRLWMATVGEPAGQARDFAQWLLGPAGQQVVRAR